MLLLGRDFEETNTLLSTEDVTRLKAGGWEPLLSSLQGRGRNVRRRKRGRPSKGKDEEEGEEDDKQEEDYSDRGSLDGLGGKRPYRGVSLNCFTRKWRANFVVNDVEVRLYHGDDEEAAARAYDSAAFHLFGK